MHVTSPLAHSIAVNMRALRVRLEHVSSGRRIVRAADDAAGMAISENLGVIADSKRMAIRNINTALEMLDMADAGAAEVAEHLVRLRELAVQAASETLSDRERGYVQEEFTGTRAAIDQVAAATTWGELPLLSFEAVDVGLIVDVSGSMAGEIAETRDSITAFRQTFQDAGLNVGLGLAVMGVDTIDGVTQRADIASSDFADELGSLGIEMFGPMSPYSALLNAAGAEDLPGEDDPDAFSWRPNPKRKVLILITDTNQEAALVPHTQAQTANMLRTRDVEVHTINQTIHNSTFNTITSVTGGQTWDIGDASGSGISTALTSIAEDLSAEFGTNTYSVQLSHTNEDSSRIELELPSDVTAQGLALTDTGVSTLEDAQDAIDDIDEALDLLGSTRASIGAQTNRLHYALDIEDAAVEATEAARSRILDADMAGEIAALAREQVLVQASVAVFAQARMMEREVIENILDSMEETTVNT